jgi:Calcineurin-like phosphoesterase
MNPLVEKETLSPTMTRVRVCAILFALAALLTLQPLNAVAQQARPADTGFSFAVYGDSRSMMYLPFRADQEADARQIMVEIFELVFPQKTAQAVVQKDVKFIYDPATHELVQVVMPFMTASEVTTLTLDKGWVTKASVEDVKLLPGVHRTMFELPGGEWVAREVVQSVKSGRAEFVLHTGDLVWWGAQGSPPSNNPYWKLVNDDVVKQLPAPDDQMRAAGLEGRVFPAVGNHEVWHDANAEGLLNAFPYLKQLGVSDKQLTYKFDFNGARFIFLWTGKYQESLPTAWGATRPSFEEQMKQLELWLSEAKAAGIRKIFVSFHSPAFARSGMGAIPEAQNPHKILASYAKDLDIVVFNGHVHTTELYQVDGVKYLLVGGGGAEQDPILPGRTSIKVPADYPLDQYWKGEPPKEEYNYLLVDVEPGQNTKFTINRFRPWAAKPFESVELWGATK